LRIENHFPAVLADAEKASGTGQSSFMRLSAVSLLLACVAAIGGALPIDVTAGGRTIDVGAVIALVAFASGVGVSSYLLSTRPQRMWYEGRAAAESIKTLAWQYAVGGGPFRVDAEPEADTLFVKMLGAVMAEMKEVRVIHRVGQAQITVEMRDLRAAPLPERRRLYLQQRVEDQITWYARRAAYNQDRVRTWFIIAIVAQTFGFVAAGLKAFAGVDVDLLGILAAVAASATAWMQTRDHQNLAESYAVTGRELQIIHTRAETGAGAGSEQDWSEFVEDTERAVSREHTLWLARRGSA
jgi:hypothetical protein